MALRGRGAPFGASAGLRGPSFPFLPLGICDVFLGDYAELRWGAGCAIKLALGGGYVDWCGYWVEISTMGSI